MVAGQCQDVPVSPSESIQVLSWVFLHSSPPNNLFSHLISTGEFIPRWLQPICPLLKWREPPASGTAPPVHEAWLLQYLLVEELYSKTRRKNKKQKRKYFFIPHYVLWICIFFSFKFLPLILLFQRLCIFLVGIFFCFLFWVFFNCGKNNAFPCLYVGA